MLTVSDGSEIDINEISTSNVYSLLLDNARRPHRCVEKFKHYSIEWYQCWHKLNLLSYDRPILDTSWLISHGSLQTADRLRRFRIPARRTCHCGADESLEHLILQCPLALHVFTWLETKVQRNLSPQENIFCVGDLADGFIVLAAILRHYLWLARNASHYDKADPDPDRIL